MEEATEAEVDLALRKCKTWLTESVSYQFQRTHLVHDFDAWIALPHDVLELHGSRLPPIPDRVLRDDEVDLLLAERFAEAGDTPGPSEADESVSASERSSESSSGESSSSASAAQASEVAEELVQQLVEQLSQDSEAPSSSSSSNT